MAHRATAAASAQARYSAVPSQVDGSPMDRAVTLTLEAVPLRQALETIADEAGLSLAYSAERVTLDGSVTLDARSLSVREALRRVLTGSGLRARATRHHLYVEPDPNVRLPRVVQTGTLRGTVYDGDTGDPLPGATILIDTLQVGDQTSVDGQYRITDLPAGTYDVRVSFVGFTTKTVTGVEVRADETTVLDVTLTATTEELDEVVVTAERQAGSTAAVLSERRTAASVVDVMSAEELAVAGGDAASALKQVAGAEVQDGKYVKVRGFGNRYGKVTINGVPVPSISRDRKSVPLDILSTDVLQSASVTKGWTPDKPADFVGGLIDLRTIETPDEPTLKVSTGLSYNTVTSFKNGLTVPGCEDAWTGFSSCFDFPSAVRTDSVNIIGTTRNVGRGDAFFYRDSLEVEKNAEALAAMMPAGPMEARLPLGESVEISGGREVMLFGRPLGLLAVGSHSYDYQQYGDYEYNGAAAADVSFWNVRQTERSVRVSGLASVNYEVSPSHEIGATGLFARRTEDLAQIQEGVWDPGGEAPFAQSVMNRQVRRQLFSGQVRGEHRIVGRATATWTAAYSQTQRMEPGTFPLLYANTLLGGNPEASPELQRRLREHGGLPDSLLLRWGGVGDAGAFVNKRYHSDLQDDAYAAMLDLIIPFRVGGRRVGFKTGGFLDLRGRQHYGRRIGFNPVNHDQRRAFDRRVPNRIFTSENVVGATDPYYLRDGNPNATEGVYVGEATLPGDNYDAAIDVYAGYAMVDAEPLPGLRLVGGVRLVQSDQSIEAYPLFLPGQSDKIPIEEEKRFTDWLPAVRARYELISDMYLRAGYGKTIGRPQFREISPTVLHTRVGASKTIGDTSLVRSKIDNFDVRWEWYPAPEAALSIGGFYKHFIYPIERHLTVDYTRYRNTGEANTFGFESEVRLPLGLVYTPLDDFAVRTNLTILRTRVGPYVFFDETSGTPYAEIIPAENRPLFGQTPFLFNAGMTYERAQWGSAVTVLFRRTGEQVRSVGIVREPLNTLDVIAEQSVGAHWTLGVEVRNILGNQIRYVYRGGDAATSINSASGVQEFYDQGRALELKLSWSLN